MPKCSLSYLSIYDDLLLLSKKMMSILSTLFGHNTIHNKVKVLNKNDFKIAIVQSPVQLIDVRTPIEYKAGHLKGAHNLNFFDQASFNKGLRPFQKNKAVYVYCQSGNRSKSAAQILARLGFEEIYDLQGGYLNW